MMNRLENIKMFTRTELTDTLTQAGFKKYRAGQIFEWMYRHGADSFDEMTNISKPERALLSTLFYIPAMRLVKAEHSTDGTRKFLFRLDDRHTVESVLIPDDDRNTLCISSQVGCAQGCRFCLTGSRGFQRNLAAFEIADQAVCIENMLELESASSSTPQKAAAPIVSQQTSPEDGQTDSGRVRHITNIVFMGMGEPLANFEHVLQALTIISFDRGLGFSPRRITVSTDGLVPEIGRLGAAGIKVNLAVSLNATTDEVRSRIMPVNRRYPIAALLEACRRFPLEPRRRITFEYVLLRDVNDSLADAERLTRLLRGIRCKINLIPFNPFTGSEFNRPSDLQVRRFQRILLDRHYTAPVRESRGRDISAACGQLREQSLQP
jgi:23S rRNA (adenine2503-C2)-methyltransferase